MFAHGSSLAPGDGSRPCACPGPCSSHSNCQKTAAGVPAAAVPSPAAEPPRRKSAKRKAAEELLAARYTPTPPLPAAHAAAPGPAQATLPPTAPTAVAAAAAVCLQGSAGGPLSHHLGGAPHTHQQQLLPPLSKRFCSTGAPQHPTPTSSSHWSLLPASAAAAVAEPPAGRAAAGATAAANAVSAPNHAAATSSHTAGSYNSAGVGGGAAVASSSRTSSQGSGSSSSSPSHNLGRGLVAVPACQPTCSHPYSNSWCHIPVQVPHVDWRQVTSGSPATISGFRIAEGYEQLTLPGGLQVLLVENAAYAGAAIQALRASMVDPVIAIDLEWRPEFNANFTPVALLQLASSRMAVLIRTCRMGFQLPSPVKQFLQDPGVTLLGCGWCGADEQKMQRTFSLGQQHLGGVLDIQQIARGLGYNYLGLANLCKAVLGVQPPKSKRVSTSNWETRTLSRVQVHYAALDVLLAGQVFRGLRLWHTCQEPCASCLQVLGAVLVGPNSRKAAGGSSSSGGGGGDSSTGQLQDGAAAPGSIKPVVCQACGRAVPQNHQVQQPQVQQQQLEQEQQQ